MLHPAQPDGRERERQRNLLAQDGGREVALVDIDQHPLAQLDAFEVGTIGAQGFLRIGAGLRIVEEGARHLAAGGLPQILDTGEGAHGRVPGRLPPA